MKVAELMETNVKTVTADMSLAEAVVTFAQGHVMGVPVVGTQDRLLGVLSTTDILQAVAECVTAADRNILFDRTLVGHIMTPDPHTVAPDDEVKNAAQQMLYLDIHRLFVVYDGTLVGVISQSDIARAVATSAI